MHQSSLTYVSSKRVPLPVELFGVGMVPIKMSAQPIRLIPEESGLRKPRFPIFLGKWILWDLRLVAVYENRCSSLEGKAESDEDL